MMERKKSLKPVKPLSEILLPFGVAFPVQVQISVNKKFWKYEAHNYVLLSFEEYEVIAHSAYAAYLGH